jgi:hypothetical protein
MLLLPFNPQPPVFPTAVKIITYKTNFACGSVWRETWSLTLREEYRLRLFQNRLLGRILGLMRNEVMGGWRKLLNEELHDLYSSPSIINRRMIKSRRMKWTGHVTRVERRGTRICY